MNICILCSSSTGNSALVTHGDTKLLIDVGTWARYIASRLSRAGAPPEDLNAILITHSHVDHIHGLGQMTDKYHIPVFSTEPTRAAICTRYSCVGDVASTFLENTSFQLGEIVIESFNTSHDSPGSVGFVFSADGARLAYVTDLGFVSNRVRTAALGATAAVIEANYDEEMLRKGPYPRKLKRRIASQSGHLSNTDSAAFAVQLCGAGAKRIILAHLSRKNNTPELAFAAVSEELTKNGYILGRDVELLVAPPSSTTDVIDVPSLGLSKQIAIDGMPGGFLVQ
jgi:phosphoribosyl 1,2-cyclic phosphodiesterase